MSREREQNAPPPEEPEPLRPPPDCDEEMEDQFEIIGNERMLVNPGRRREPQDLQPTPGIRVELSRMNTSLENLEGKMTTVAHAMEFHTNQLQRWENRYWQEKMEGKQYGEGMEKMDAYVKREKEEKKERERQQQSSFPGSGIQREPCLLCLGEHFANQCMKLATLEERYHRVYDLNKCERCLKHANHLVTACLTKSTCFYCEKAGREKESKKHHSAFCHYTFPMTKDD